MNFSLFETSENSFDANARSRGKSQSRAPLRAVTLRKRWIKRANQLHRALYECGDDVAFWCETIGYDVFERPLPKNITAVLLDGAIFVRPRLSFAEQVISIAHEIFHHEFHGASSGYRDLSDGVIELEECQAESFALLVLEDSLLNYASIEEYRFKTKVPNNRKQMREELYYKIEK